MSEESRKIEELIKAEFQKLFPLCPENLLPWWPTQIGPFLKDRIEKEVARQSREGTSELVRVLCEVVPQKRYLVDMARSAVDEIKLKRSLLSSLIADIDVNLERWAKENANPPDKEELQSYFTSLRKRIVNSGAMEH